MVVGRGGFRRRVRDVLGCERGNMPEWTMPALLVLVLAVIMLMWFKRTYPDRAATLEAWLEAHGHVLDWLCGLMLIGLCLVWALVVGLFLRPVAECWLRGRRGRMGPPGAGSGGGAEVGAQDPQPVLHGEDDG